VGKLFCQVGHKKLGTAVILGGTGMKGAAIRATFNE